MRKSKAFYHTQDSVWGGVVLHGVGAKMWWDEYEWRPSFVGIQDILIPTDTDLTMENLRYFAVRRGMRPGRLFTKTFGAGKNIDRGWKMKKVQAILDDYKDLNTNPRGWDWANNPEQMTELFKQNRCYYDGDSAPMIWFWDFYHREEENDNPMLNGWYRKMILDRDCKPLTDQSNDGLEFVYSSNRRFAETLDSIIHFQFGDGNNVPPFKYHSIRSLAWLIYDLAWTMNRLNCQFTQHVFEQMMLLFRVTDPGDRDRLQKLILQGIVGLIPEGLNMVTAQERYQVNTDLVQGLMSNLKQRVGEASSQYTQAVDNGTQKERTKYEVQAVLAQSSALMASMLGRAYRQEYFAMVEIARRFTEKKSPNFDVKKFLQRCKDSGVPEKWLDSSRWEIEVEQVLGNGNRMLELAEATELMNRVVQFDPHAAQEIKHDYVLAVTNNPKKAARLAPLDAVPKITDSIHDAQQSFGTLMLGVDMQPLEGVNHSEQIETLLGMMYQRIQMINGTGAVGTPQDVMGLQAVAKYVSQHIEILAKDLDAKEKVAEYTKGLSKLMNDVRAFMQRQQEAAAQTGAQQDPELMARMQAQQMELDQRLKAKQAETEQAMQQSEAQFQQEMRHSHERADQELKIKAGQALATTQIEAMKAAAQPAPAETNGK
jgi:hypothetical protein